MRVGKSRPRPGHGAKTADSGARAVHNRFAVLSMVAGPSMDFTQKSKGCLELRAGTVEGQPITPVPQWPDGQGQTLA